MRALISPRLTRITNSCAAFAGRNGVTPFILRASPSTKISVLAVGRQTFAISPQEYTRNDIRRSEIPDPPSKRATRALIFFFFFFFKPGLNNADNVRIVCLY